MPNFDEKKIDSWLKELECISQGLDQILALTHDMSLLSHSIDRLHAECPRSGSAHASSATPTATCRWTSTKP